MRNTTEIQRYLIGKGFLAEGGDDGTFGQLTLDAYNRDRKSRGKPAVVLGQFSLMSVNADLFPESRNPKPKGPTIMGNIFSGLFSNLLNWQLIQGYLRNALISLGTVLVTNGVITDGELNTVVGAIMIVVSVVLSAVSNNTKVKAVDIAKAADANPKITVVPAAETATGKPVVKVAT